MKRMKTFFIYALIIAAFWIFSDIIIYLSVNGAYKTKTAKVYVSSPEVIITESKATYVNGVIKGGIKNNTKETVEGKYLKIDMYSSRDNNLGTKYVKINNLKENEVQEFEMGYKFTDVEYLTVRVTDNIEGTTIDQFESQKLSLYYLISTLLFLYLI